MIVSTFKRWHIDWLESVEPGTLPLDAIVHMEAGNARTVLTDDGVALMCGGTLQHWPGRHMAWALFDKKAAPHMLAITRATKTFFDEVQGRIEFTVRCDFAAGHKFAKLLGFEVETPLMRMYGPEGEDHVGYIRVN